MAYREVMTGSSAENVSVDGGDFYTGSVINIERCTKIAVAGQFTKSGLLGSACQIYMAISYDNSSWNYFYKSGSLISDSTPYIIVDLNSLASWAAPVLYNASGSALSGSCWIRGLR